MFCTDKYFLYLIFEKSSHYPNNRNLGELETKASLSSLRGIVYVNQDLIARVVSLQYEIKHGKWLVTLNALPYVKIQESMSKFLWLFHLYILQNSYMNEKF